MYNPQGDVIGLFNDNLDVVVEYAYDSWGNVLSITGSHASTLGQDNPFRYRGYYYDSETGMYYLNSRYYHPEIGRFINADGYVQTGQGLLDKNMFAYCGNNPILFRDPSGCCYEITIPAVGSGPVIVTDSKGNSYSYNAPQVGNTYYFDAKDFQSAVINGTVEEFLQPIVQTSAEYLGDGIANGLMTSLNNANLTYLIPYGHELNAVSSGFGLVSLLSLGLQVAWDYENYGNDWKLYAKASLITLASFGLTIGAGLLIASCSPIPIVGVAMAVCAGVAISTAADLAREAWLPKGAIK